MGWWLPPTPYPEEETLADVYPISRAQSDSQMPGNPTWGPLLDATRAIAREKALFLDDPAGAIDWDRKSDHRLAHWLSSPFAAPIVTMFKMRFKKSQLQLLHGDDDSHGEMHSL